MTQPNQSPIQGMTCGLCHQSVGVTHHVCAPVVIKVYSEEQYKALESQLERITRDAEGLNGDVKSWRRIADETLDVNRLLDAEVDRITKENAYHEQRMKDNHSQAVKNAIVIDELRDKLERVQEDNLTLKARNETLNNENTTLLQKRNEYYNQITALMDQLAAKDKVLESIKNAPAYTSRTWMREQASSILSQYATINEQSEQVIIRTEVRWFAEQMELTLRSNDHKGGWKVCDFDYLANKLMEEREEVDSILDAHDEFMMPPASKIPEELFQNLVRELTDEANICMMIADNARNATINESKEGVAEDAQRQMSL